MFSPRYLITHQLLANIKRITELVTELNHRTFPSTVLLDFSKDARAVSVHSSTSIEGNPLPLTEVRKLLKSRPEHLRDSEKEVLNYNQALEELETLLTQSGTSGPLLNLKRYLEIHNIVMKGLLPPIKRGKLRKEPVFVNDPRLGKTIYWPPDHKDVPGLMQELMSFVEKEQGKLDPLILAGLFHKQSLIIHPFIDGNGRTTRLATTLLLANMGLNTFPLFSFERYYNQNVTRYFEKVGVLGDYYDLRESIDFTPWLEYFTSGIIDELMRVKKDLEQVSLTPETTPNTHDRVILDYIREHGFITDKYYARLTERAKATRTLDFKRLVGMGVIERKGKGKNTYYVLAKPPE
ncbi:MAG: Fic family protein [Candidatus Sericytochromatia bacterium]